MTKVQVTKKATKKVQQVLVDFCFNSRPAPQPRPAVAAAAASSNAPLPRAKMLMLLKLLREMTCHKILKPGAPIALKKIKASVNYCLEIMSFCEDSERDSPDAISAALDVRLLFICKSPYPIAMRSVNLNPLLESRSCVPLHERR
jgi:hypothetical protein